jgi:hypothetical protein
VIIDLTVMRGDVTLALPGTALKDAWVTSFRNDRWCFAIGGVRR